MSEGLFYLQDTRSLVGPNLVWWALEGNGYTTDLDKAQTYTKDEAQRMHNSRISDVPWSKSYVDGKSFLAVDHQYLRKDDCLSLAESPEDELFYVQASGDYAGNDLYWRVEKGFPTSNLSKAKVYSREEAGKSVQSNPENIAWPKRYIDTKTRPVADHRDGSQAEANDGIDISIQKPPKPRKETFRCCGCGVFMSVGQYFSGGCSRCGTDSRP